MKILVVDDESDICEFLVEFLQDHNFTASSINNPSMAEDYINNNQFDLVIIDYHMPKLSGLEIIAKTKQQNKKTKFVLMSGNALDVSKTNSSKIELADGVLEKPFDCDSLVSYLENIYNNK